MKRSRFWIFGALILVTVTLLPSHRRSAYTADVPEGIDISEGTYRDGTYREAVGYQPGLMVEIEIVDGELDTVSVVDHSEIGWQYYNRPIRLIPDAIVEGGNTEVDVVGGATATSTGIMAAVEDALAKAAG